MEFTRLHFLFRLIYSEPTRALEEFKLKGVLQDD